MTVPNLKEILDLCSEDPVDRVLQDDVARRVLAGGGCGAVRRCGFGRRAMPDLCRLLLGHASHVCLFVRPENAPAIHAYEATGMRRVSSYRNVIL